jgi:hypothetical protein
MATVEERNARLDALEKAVQQYQTAQLKTLKRRVDVCQRILQGRTGSTRLAQAAVQQSSQLAVTSINQFLTG